MRRVFKDEALQKEFDQNGFVVIKAFDDKQIEFLRSLTEGGDLENTNKPANKAHEYKLSFYESNTDHKKYLFDQIEQNIFPLFKDVLDNYEPLIINYFNKKEDAGEVPIHQNWTFVDEKKFTSVSIWCPLIPVSRANGTLEVIPGSHKVTGLYRGAKIPFSFTNIKDVLKQKYFKPFEFEPGYVAILDDSLIHYSSENKQNVERKAFQIIAKPKEAQAIYMHQDKYVDHGELEVYKTNKDFFFGFNLNEKPQNVESMGKVPFSVHFLNEEEFKNMLETRESIMHSKEFESLNCVPQ